MGMAWAVPSTPALPRCQGQQIPSLHSSSALQQWEPVLLLQQHSTVPRISSGREASNTSSNRCRYLQAGAIVGAVAAVSSRHRNCRRTLLRAGRVSLAERGQAVAEHPVESIEIDKEQPNPGAKEDERSAEATSSEEVFDPEHFIFGDRRPWHEVGLQDPRLLRVLKRLGFLGSTKVQATSIPLVLNKDRRAVLINAETGSGKTLAYLLPALELILRSSPRREGTVHPQSLILVPSRELAHQVTMVARQFATALSKLGAKITVGSEFAHWPQVVPDILICTARAAAQGLQPCTSEDEIARRAALMRLWDVQMVVFDEVDLLFNGASAGSQEIQSVMVALAASWPNKPRQVSKDAQKFYAGGVPVQVLQPDHAWRKARAFWNQGGGDYNVHYEDGDAEWEKHVKRGRLLGPGIGLHVEHGPRIVLACATLPSYKRGRYMTESSKKRRTQAEEIDNRLFNSGIGSPDWLIKRWFPMAIRVESEWIHRRHPCIADTEWIFINGEDRSNGRKNIPLRLQTMIEVLERQEEDAHTLIFANSPEVCVAAEASLQGERIPCVAFHSAVPLKERLENLRDFATGKVRTLVATDLAARGLDLPVCRHVIQLEFAKTSVDYIQRIGRSARAGKASKLTNLWGEPDRFVKETIEEVPNMGLDGAVMSKQGNKSKMQRIRKRNKKSEFAYDEIRMAGRAAREHTRRART